MRQHIDTSLGAKAASRLGADDSARSRLIRLSRSCTRHVPPTPRRRWLVPFYAHTVLVQAVTFVLRPTAIYRALELDVPGPVARRPRSELRDRPAAARRPRAGTPSTASASGGSCSSARAHAHCGRGFLALGDSAVWGLLAASVLLGTGPPVLGGGSRRWWPTAPRRALRHRVRPLHVRRVRWPGARTRPDRALRRQRRHPRHRRDLRLGRRAERRTARRGARSRCPSGTPQRPRAASRARSRRCCAAPDSCAR